MARSKKNTRREADDTGYLIKWSSSILLIALGLILLLGAFGMAGFAGQAIFSFAFGIVGVAAFILPILIIGAGVAIMLERMLISTLTTVGIGLIVISALTFFGILTNMGVLIPSEGTSGIGGIAGNYAGAEASKFFGIWGSFILLSALSLVGVGILFDLAVLAQFLMQFGSKFGAAFSSIRLSKKQEATDVPEADPEMLPAAAEADAPAPLNVDREPVVTMFNRAEGDSTITKMDTSIIPNFDAEYKAPPLSILGEDKGKPGVGDIKANANIIKRTFQNFGISVEMDEVSVGPTVTRYAIKPAEGVRLSKILSLQNNLELALAAHPVRIEAPIPGKSLVGIEVPNAAKAMVGLGGVLSAPEWNTSTKPILAGLGRDIAGTPHYVNVAKMPHALVAGATGSGKSVAIHALVTSLLYRNGPNQLRFIMVDPKRVELTLYNGIPHLLTPVITDPKKCIMALKWAAKEMDRRYNILEEEQVRDIESYHKTVLDPAKKKGAKELPEEMPYIAIFIDELADIMQTYPRELEAAIVRLAQMSRAVGIHLILSTQRPSVNVITGLIKANVPTRMALQVASQIDSRTILDAGGAEQLLGAGDMLYMSADMQKPVRIQTAYISEAEVKKVVSYIKQHNAGSLNALDLGNGTGGGVPVESNDAMMLSDADGDVDDDLYSEARAAVEEAGRASTSYLQRKLRIGYSRAARLMDLLEEKGVIGPADGSRPRDVLSRSGAPVAADTPDEEVF